ncbi:hypothetical protein EBT31_20645, partial [bacterium]|nr:hypothetical protein [bacterium]
MSLVSARILEEEIAIDLIARSEARGQDVAFKDQLRDRLDKLRTRGLHAAARISGCMYNSHVVVSVGNEVAVHTAWQVPIDEEAVDAFVSTFPTEPYPAGDRTQESFMELVCDKLLNRTPVCDPLVEDYASWAWFFCLSALRGAR